MIATSLWTLYPLPFSPSTVPMSPEILDIENESMAVPFFSRMGIPFIGRRTSKYVTKSRVLSPPLRFNPLSGAEVRGDRY